MTTTPEPRPLVAPTPGRIIIYRLSEMDAVNINVSSAAYNARYGAAANQARAGDMLPAIIVRTFGHAPTSPCNIKVFIYGPTPDYWATSRVLGDADGQWSWPARA
jgi:hypothetical protein